MENRISDGREVDRPQRRKTERVERLVERRMMVDMWRVSVRWPRVMAPRMDEPGVSLRR